MKGSRRGASEPRRREVLITRPFRASFANLAEHYTSLKSLFPDSGSRLAAFNDDLFERIILTLERHPDIGRIYAYHKLESQTESALLAEIAPIFAAHSAVTREWVEREFTIIYVVTPGKVFLVNLKHHRQLGY